MKEIEDKKGKNKKMPWIIGTAAIALLVVSAVGLYLWLRPLPKYSVDGVIPTDERYFSFEDNADGTLKLIRYDGNSTDIVIPAKVDGKKVTIIGDRAFMGIELDSVIMPNTIITIEDGELELDQSGKFHGAFGSSDENGGLSHIVLSESLEYIGDYAFANDSLSSITIPQSVTWIGRNAFISNAMDTVIFEMGKDYDEGVEVIQENAFMFNKLTDLDLPNNLRQIESSAFMHNQIRSLRVRDFVDYIGDYAFADNRIENLSIGNKVNDIGDSAFQSNKIVNVNIPSTVKTIGKDAFANNDDLDFATFPPELEYQIEKNHVFSGYYYPSTTYEGDIEYWF